MRLRLIAWLGLVIFPVVIGEAAQLQGDVWGVWTRESSPYNVIGHLRVPPGSTLVVEPGVVVNFQSHFKFIVDSSATLLAVGTESDSIHFTADDAVGGWHGIHFLDADDLSQISYCRLEYGRSAETTDQHDAGGAVHCYRSSPTISHNAIVNSSAAVGGGIACLESDPVITYNTITGDTAHWGGGIFCFLSSPTISHNTISGDSAGDYGGGIFCQQSSPTIHHNTISDNRAFSDGGGIYCVAGSNPAIEYNRIDSNSVRGNPTATMGGGIFCQTGSSPTIIYNTITGNSADSGGALYCRSNSNPIVAYNTISRNSGREKGGGIYCSDSSPTLTNTILWGNRSPEGSEIYASGSLPIVSYCAVQGDWPGMGNIDADPLFRDPDSGDFHLQSITNPDCGGEADSPCIDAGHPDSLDAILDCLHGLGTGRADIGAYGGNGSGWFTGVEGGGDDGPSIPKQFLLNQNHPNPFNATTIINYQLPISDYVRLEVYNLLGQKVNTLIDGKRKAGYGSVIWDASDVSSGLYFYKLTAGDFAETKRMILVE